MRILSILGAILAPMLALAGVDKIVLPATPGLTRSEVWVGTTVKRPKAVLILCPGMNASGESLARDGRWQEFAKTNQLGLMAISFASNPSDLFDGRGYTFAGQGSGKLLLRAVREHYGQDLPLLLYGFSSGAYFTEEFVQWSPGSVLAWCAHATGRYEENPRWWPPGIVSCGSQDPERLGAALTHFKKGRAAGGNLVWISIPECAHECPERLNQFVRTYFEAVLQGAISPEWIDIDTEKTLTATEAGKKPSLSAWLPSRQLATTWKNIHQP